MIPLVVASERGGMAKPCAVIPGGGCVWGCGAFFIRGEGSKPETVVLGEVAWDGLPGDGESPATETHGFVECSPSSSGPVESAVNLRDHPR